MARRRLCAAVVLALLVPLVALPSAAAAPAVAAPLYGHDISWPQCPTPDGNSLPLPPTTTQFVIVGLTRGLPFTENPCLALQVDWVRSHGKPAQAYTIPAFPTAAQLSTYGARGPWLATTHAGRLSNVGYAQATFALNSLRRVSFAPDVVWIDVEPRTAQPWPAGSAAQQRENRYVIEGMMRGLHDAGQAYGVYSNQSGWQSITGSWWLPGVPVWATAGTLDYPTEALDRCTQPSFSGGRVYIAQWWDATRDYDLTCGTYAFTALPVPPATLSNSTADWNGDWGNDVFGRWASSGDLWLYSGNGRSGWLSYGPIGFGWQIMDALETPGDFNGDGALDVLAREPTSGALWLYPGTGHGGWLPRVQVGWNWNPVDAIVGVGDWNGDQRADILARIAATGEMYLYPGNGSGGWLPRVLIGRGWNIIDAIVGVGDWNGDGAADVLARERSTGLLWLYPGNGTGSWLPGAVIGYAWNAVNGLVGAGDVNGDRTADLLARETSTGHLWLYPGDGAGGWLPRVLVGVGWQPLDAIF